MNKLKKPDFLFEISWEVCNKVGGINTVIATKAIQMSSELNGRFIMIGPDIHKENNIEAVFIEDPTLYRQWVNEARGDGFRFRIGRWNIAGQPLAILIDFTGLFAKKDEVFKLLWEDYKLDSIYGGWDYIEPALFGYEAARLIDSFYQYHVAAEDHIAAHFHEWMCGAGILYLKKNVPQAATVFTSHATVLGRSIAGMNMPLYDKMEEYKPAQMASQLNVSSKFSLEQLSAQHADAFTTVSKITARECTHFLSKEPDLVTPNGFEDSFVPSNDTFDQKRTESRNILRKITKSVSGSDPGEDALFIVNSGRYEFKNKGIDLFIDAMSDLSKRDSFQRDVVAFITVPANNAGVRHDVLRHFKDNTIPEQSQYLTHYLFNEENDPIIQRLKERGIDNAPNAKVKAIFVPSYLDGNDGLINLHYYDLLIGFDISVFPSYYEPWGYTPLESVAFKIPTITTTLAGFGMWIRESEHKNKSGVKVIERNDYNDTDVVNDIVEALYHYATHKAEDCVQMREDAYQASRLALWDNLAHHYFEAYNLALDKVYSRSELFNKKKLAKTTDALEIVKSEPNWRKVFIKPSFPDNLSKLIELTKNLWWSWNPAAQNLFAGIHPQFWEKSGRNPIAMLEMMSFEALKSLSENEDFQSKLDLVYTDFQNYINTEHDQTRSSVAYFCMEYGLHASLKLYSGGLGILAGDYLKEASDSNIRMNAVGLLFRYGYFNQKISPFGDQISEYIPQKFSNLPIIPVRDEEGNWLKISIDLPVRRVFAKVWKVVVGRVNLYLMDADIDENNAQDRVLTHQLYGGDWEMRLKQEMLLGLGGIKMLSQIGLEHDVYHCNEGHAAFIHLERLKNIIRKKVLSFSQALEIVRSSSLFTTHTPVPAGHDSFSEDMLRMYLAHFPDKLNISWDEFYALGKMDPTKAGERFSMSILAMNASQEVNGVSKIHGRVTREMFTGLYKGYYSDELYIGHVTNGVHLPTWISDEWRTLFKAEGFDPMKNDQADKTSWAFIEKLSDEKIWNVRKSLKKKLVSFLSDKLSKDLTKRQDAPRHIINVLENLDKNALIFGFARRFATYKRAHLLFKNLDRLKLIVNNEKKPVRFLFAGKAHPADKAGQNLIKRIIEISKMDDFAGKIIFLENYDSEIAKVLIAGVDVWINTPTRPLEASGTSGMKASMNGVLNLSVLDGWWAEGYVPGGGWALKENKTYDNQQLQDELDVETLYNIIEDEIVPLYYKQSSNFYSCDWIQFIRKNFMQISPNFTTKRMLDEYYSKFYGRLHHRNSYLIENEFEAARALSSWKRKMLRNWNEIEVINMKLHDSTARPLLLGEDFKASVELLIGELDPNDIRIDLLFGQKENDMVKEVQFKTEMKLKSSDDNTATYECIISNPQSGVFDYAIRMRPYHPDLPHYQDFNLVRWL